MANHPRTWTLIPPAGTRFVNEFGSNCTIYFIDGQEEEIFNSLTQQLAEQLRMLKMIQQRTVAAQPTRNISRDIRKSRVPTGGKPVAPTPAPGTMGAAGSIKEIPPHLSHILGPQMGSGTPSPVDKPRGQMVTKMTQHGLQTSLEPPDQSEQFPEKGHDPTINIEVSQHLRHVLGQNPVEQGNEIVDDVNDNTTDTDKEIDPNDAA